MSKLAFTEADIADVTKAMREGRGVIVGCIFDHCVQACDRASDGRLVVEVVARPALSSDPTSTALRTHMEQVAVGWLEIVAPHRLAATE